MSESDSTTTKRCSKCGLQKSLDDFNRDRSKQDRRRPECRVCTAAIRQGWQPQRPTERPTLPEGAADLPGYDGYAITRRGELFSIRKNRGNRHLYFSREWIRLSLHIDSGGYPVVGLSVDGKSETCRVHELVLETFVGPRPSPNAWAVHLDGDRANNALQNLRWLTQQDRSRFHIPPFRVRKVFGRIAVKRTSTAIFNVKQKRCTRCNCVMDRRYFGTDKRHRDGLQSHCRACELKADRERRRNLGAKTAAPPLPSSIAPPVGGRTIPGYSGYVATEDGRIFSNLSAPQYQSGGWHELRQSISRDGYCHASIKPDGEKSHIASVHRLILLAFSGLPNTGQVCRHLDGNRSNNNATNLRWGTQTENAEDRRRHGTMRVGTRSHHAILTEESVEAIRILSGLGWSEYKLSKAFRISVASVSHIRNGKSWRHVC